MLTGEALKANLQRRAAFYHAVRLFFAERDVLEVTTPILSSAAPTATYLDSFTTEYQSAGYTQTRYLQTSPEFAMKRLLAGGSGAIYQIATVFRNGEQGRLHAPEFAMLEWYRPGFSINALMNEVDELLQKLINAPPCRRFSYHQLFRDYLNIDIFDIDTETLQKTAVRHIEALPDTWQTDFDGWLEMLMSEYIEPRLAQLQQPVLVTDFPASQAQLAKTAINEQGHHVARRFELYAGGMELANGYDELGDAEELRQRFEQDNRNRQQQGKPLMPLDEHLLTALQSGLPQCSGVALGLDRLLMLNHQHLDIHQIQTIAFAEN